MTVNVVHTFESLSFLIDADTSLFFIFNDGKIGVSRNNTEELRNIDVGGDVEDAEEIVGLNGKIFFDGFGNSGEEPYSNDGTSDGTVVLKDINPTPDETSDPRNFVAVGETVFFIARDGENGEALYASDGTTEGTSLVADISSDDYYSYSAYNPFGYQFIDFNGTLYFQGNSEVNSNALWKSDGTPEGTALVADFNFNFDDFTIAEDELYFNPNGELWLSDGTTEGTRLVAEVSASQLEAVGNSVYFSANESSAGQELWVTDGTIEGTKLVKDIRPEERTGGSPFNYGSNPGNLTDVNGTLFFTADDGTNGVELWKSDGTEEGTQLVADITEGSSYLNNFVAIGDTLYFLNGGFNAELWQSDGTAEGTFAIEPEEIGLGSSTTPSFQNPEQLIERDGELYFTGEAYNAETGQYIPALLTIEDVDTTIVYRLFNPDVGVHFYTTDVAERDEFVASGNYNLEGASYRSVEPSAEGAEEVFRFFNKTTGVYLYTTSEAERDNIINTLPDFTFEGTRFNAYETEVEGSIPIYRFFEPSIGVHLYTPSTVERDAVQADLPNYDFEGIAYYALPLETETGAIAGI